MLFATSSHPIPHIIHLLFPTYFHHIQWNFLSCCKVSSHLILPSLTLTYFLCPITLPFNVFYFLFSFLLLLSFVFYYYLLSTRFFSCFATSSESMLLLIAHAIFYSTSLHHIQYHFLSFFITSSSHFLSPWPTSFHPILYFTSSYHYLLFYFVTYSHPLLLFITCEISYFFSSYTVLLPLNPVSLPVILTYCFFLWKFNTSTHLIELPGVLFHFLSSYSTS